MRKALRIAFTLAASILTLGVLVRPTEDAVANGDTRSISLVHMHTGETLDVVYKRNGVYDADALKKLNWFLRDWRREEPTRMDPRLFDIVWMSYRAVGATQPIHVVCGYRAPETNAMLRRRSRGVAKFSQHTLGKAMDFYIPGVRLSDLRAAGLKLQRGGVGFYPTSGSPFIHMDAGSVRMWPKMTRAQLASIFPDGKTVHIPADGRPMPGYQAAYAELQRNGGSVGGFVGGDEDDGGGPSFFARLFGGGGSTETAARDTQRPQAVVMAGKTGTVIAPAPMPAATRVPAPAPTPAAPEPAPVVVAKLERTVPIPLPEPRPAELAGPQLAWQAGPDGQPATAVVAAASIPLPPARPGLDRAADAPPVQLAALDQTQDASPELRPGAPVMADASRSIDLLLRRDTPLPPSRALGFADAGAGLIAKPRSERPPLIATRFEKLNFVSVTAPVATARNKAQAGLVRPDLKSVGSLIPAPSKVVVMRFGVAAYQDLRAEKFTGTAIKPLRTASFALAPDIITGSVAKPDPGLN
ncbi:DUF882 domain-containing protein [Labrys wisconsinensis]|uniref:Murein endopeptidase K n=1 Tax=Labrys wisconsinensis TaxID=425677 RepID=A0ABU0J110_9HYPH|nr:DUF882 domain-containing protein [Labrys wisconsinensis]MDQ0467945.1 uncharacterized protein YcbK (DUF882 family) [Labrys wisconsinensis]